MKILFLSSLCSKSKYDSIYNKRTAPMLDSNQKFLLSIVQGLISSGIEEITCISSIPVSYKCYPDKILRTEREVEGGIKYVYCGGLNYPVIRNLTVEKIVSREVKKYIRQNQGEKIVAICDILRSEVSASVNWLKKMGIPTVAIITDIPTVAESMTGEKGLRKILLNQYAERANQIIQKFDSFILLSELMNDYCNKDRKKPFMIMECIIDATTFDDIEEKTLYKRPTVLYAGKYYKECGVLQFAKTAKYLNDICEVVLFGGHGDCDEELRKEANKTDNLHINGIVSLNEILAIEKGSTLLVNPRPDTEMFTKYSFPSKTAEYMLSGVPVIMYDLPSLPDEYKDYLYLFDSTDPVQMADSIRKLLENGEEISQRALNANLFIKEKKNKEYQSQRIIDFIERLINEATI